MTMYNVYEENSFFMENLHRQTREVKLTSTLTSYIVMSDCRDDLKVLAR